MTEITKEVIIEDLTELLAFFKKWTKDPMNSNKAGEVYILFKRLNDALDKV